MKIKFTLFLCLLHAVCFAGRWVEPSQAYIWEWEIADGEAVKVSRTIYDTLKYEKEQSGGCLDVPASFDGCKVVELRDIVGKFTSISIPDSIRRISGRIDGNVRLFVVPDSVMEIGDGANRYNSNIKLVTTKAGWESGDRHKINEDKDFAIILPDSLRTIGASAFAGCSSLAFVRVPPALTELGEYAFGSCEVLKEVWIDTSGHANVYRGAFSLCDQLREVHILGGVTNIENSAFYGCTWLSQLELPDGLLRIGDNIIGETRLSDVRIPASVKDIGCLKYHAADDSCSSLRSVTFDGDAPSYFRRWVAEYEYNLANPSYPRPTESTEVYVWPWYVASYENLSFTYYTTHGSYDWSPTKIIPRTDALIKFEPMSRSVLTNENVITLEKPHQGIDLYYTINGGTPDKTSARYTGKIELPLGESTVRVVGYWGGDGKVCTSAGSWASYTVIDVPVRTITFDANGGECNASEMQRNEGAPYGTLPIPTRTGYVFDGWWTQDEGGKKIEQGSLVDFDRVLRAHWLANILVKLDADGGQCDLDEVGCVVGRQYGNLPVAYRSGCEFAGWWTAREGGMRVESSSIVCVDVDVLYAHWLVNVVLDANGGACSTTKLQVTYGKSIGVLPMPERTCYQFLGWFTQPEGGEPVSENAIVFEGVTFYAHWKLIEAYEWVTEVLGDGTLAIMGSTTSPIGYLEIPSNVAGRTVTCIGEKAFYGCDGITDVVIPPSVTIIGDKAFYGCVDLTSVTMSGGLKYIGILAFSYCKALKKVEIPASVTCLNVKAFECCDGLSTLVLLEGMTSIGQYAFHDCSGLTSVTVPSTVRNIGYYAFERCCGLESVTISEGVESIGGCAFYGCSKLMSVMIPSSVICVEERAFGGCSSLTTVYVGIGDTERVRTMMMNSGLDVTGLKFEEVERKFFRVTFDATGGAVEQAFREVVYDTEIGDLPNASRAGHEFLGWFTAVEGGTRLLPDTIITEDVTYYAHWRKVEIEEPKSVFHVDASDLSTMEIVTESGKNYVVRWNDASGGGIYATAGSIRPMLKTVNDKQIVDFGGLRMENYGSENYGAWMRWSESDRSVREVFIVCCDNPEGNVYRQFVLTSDVSDWTYDFHRSLNLQCVQGLFDEECASDRVKNGLIQVDGTTVPYDYALSEGLHVIHIRTTGNVTANTFAKDRTCRYGGLMIAEVMVYDEPLDDETAGKVQQQLIEKWLTHVPVLSVAFETVGGSPTPSPLSKSRGEVYGELPEVQRAGYDFAGWWTASDGGVRVGSADVVQESITLYAHWRILHYKINYDLSGGINAGVNPMSYTVEDAVILADPTREGYDFVGWSPDHGVIAKGSTGDKTFAANWKQRTHVGGLVAWYKFDGNLNDDSGNGYDMQGTIDGYAIGCCSIGQALSFSGGTFVSPENVIEIESSFTISGWLKSEEDIAVVSERSSGIQANGKMVLTPGHGAVEGAGVGFAYGKNGVAIYEHGSSYLPVVLMYNAAIGTGWNFVTITVADNAAPKLYLNGKFVKQGVQGDRNYRCVKLGKNAASIGGEFYGNRFYGNVDDFRIYNRALSESEIEALCNGESDWQPVDVILPKEVSGGAEITIPAQWVTESLPRQYGEDRKMQFVKMYGSDYGTALLKKSGKVDCAGNELYVWQDYVAGTDPTDSNSLFRAFIDMVNGCPQIRWEPNLNGTDKNRIYTVFGKYELSDEQWHSPTNGRSRFFKVSVEMP